MPQESEHLRFVIIIPAYNESENIGQCLDSLLRQSHKAKKIIVVDDGSTDNTAQIIQDYALKYNGLESVSTKAESRHEPGAKVINAFKKGLDTINLNEFDIICKFDADLEFPEYYLEHLNKHFLSDAEIGLCSGVCSVLKNNEWQTEKLTNSDHVRGALKAYKVEAFEDISGLLSQMGWDTADEFKLRYRNWKVKVDESLIVKHFKPTAAFYKDEFYKKQGEVFFALRYGFFLTFIAALKIAYKRHQIFKFLLALESYISAGLNKTDYLLSREEGIYLRKYRWQRFLKKIEI